ncbi:MAG: hypothetical protein A3C07_00325 [Candidatus Sungbacteria bacterium RIFCSPHIGHO2_02_FULL_47_11]|uniref:Tagatose-bisphosphate aldolase n=1 Tax=Candidatus Sungbacteria bacterium RIFCSPHIGHO2_02_FULL_47_11 TaxID=1802270 RepID=A0A1G2KH01_9BACT|nr:MAG: hypothetical protein A3C07_00325 [Candidatus Sungbacteria bacterium RIFCSPHIGHO2_02_FULL_47_11]
MISLKEYVMLAAHEQWSVGHFNASELDQFRAIVEACKEAGAPAFVGTSESEREHLGLAEAVALRDTFRKEYDIPIFLNADHTKSVEAAKKAIDAGYDSVHIDLSKSSLEENIKGTREVVEYTKQKSKHRKSKVIVEGEVGYLVTDSSKVYKERIEIPQGSLTKPEEAERFVKETGVEFFAPVVGNLHGIAANEPNIDFKRIRDIRTVLPENIGLVLHGGSGIPDEQVRAAVRAGIAVVHINTELRVAFTDALRKSLSEHLDEVAMYKLDEAAGDAMGKTVIDKLKLLGSENRI